MSKQQRFQSCTRSRCLLLGGVPVLMDITSAFWSHSYIRGLAFGALRSPKDFTECHIKGLGSGRFWICLRAIRNDDLPPEELQFARELLARQFGEGADSTKDRPRESHLGWASHESFLDKNGLPEVGSVLLAHPSPYFAQDRRLGGGSGLHELGFLPAAALRTGLPTSTDDSTRRERASLPVVLLTHKNETDVEGLLLGAWSGKLLGDLGLEAFMTRPLYLGGPKRRGLSMLHSYPEMPESSCLIAGDESLATSSNFSAACSWVSEGPGSSLRFKFFLNYVAWERHELDELKAEAGVWIPLQVSRDLLLREPDSSFEEPLWAQLAERAGSKVEELANQFGLLRQ